jgi:hypothetical protein
MIRIQTFLWAVFAGVLVNAFLGECTIEAQAPKTPPPNSSQSAGASDNSLHDIYGTVRAVKGSQFTIEARAGRLVQVDASTAFQTYRGVNPTVGHAVGVRGTFDAKGVLHAEMVMRAKDSSAMWPADR